MGNWLYFWVAFLFGLLTGILGFVYFSCKLADEILGNKIGSEDTIE